MIRINLMPQKRLARRRGETAEAAAGPSQTWVAFLLGALVLEVVVLLFVYKAKQDELTQVQNHNHELSANIEGIKREISAHAEVKAQLKELRDREEAIQKLQDARTGPTATMLELSRVMTPGRNPTIDNDKLEQLKHDNPSAVPNPNWDPRRLWLVSYKEENRLVRLGGLARDGEDVSEFLRRLSLSDYFYDVGLLPASKAVDPVSKMELVKFEMSAKVRY